MRTTFLTATIALLVGLTANAASAQEAWTAAPIGWKSFDEAIANQSQKKILIDIYAPWCGWCRRMHQEVYPNAEVQEYLLEHFNLTRLDITEEGDTLSFKGYRLNSMTLAGGLGATATPTTVFLEPNGDYITRLPGYASTEDFLNILQFIATNAYQTQSFQDFLNERAPTSGQ
jgi:thioredoxin-related protein